MSRVYVTVLKPAHDGSGEWDWVEGTLCEACQDLDDYEELVNSGPGAVDYQRAGELDGRVRNPRGVIYRFTAGQDPDGHPITVYEMVWVEEDAQEAVGPLTGEVC